MGLFSSLTKPSWERSKKRAEKAASAGDPAAAHDHYGEALEECPEPERAALEAARAQCASDLHANHMGTARQLQDSGQWGAASERFELALRFAVESEQRQSAERALRELATAKLDRTEAREVEETEEAEPVDPQTVFMMLLGDLPEEVADEYEALGEEFRGAYLLAQQGKPEEALPVYASLTAGAPESAVPHFEYGNALVALGRHDDAVEQFERAEALDQAWTDVKLALAQTAWRLERWELAEGALQRAVDRDQDDPRVYAAIAHTALLTETPDYGLEATEAGLELDPIHRGLILNRGQLLDMADRPEEALVLYEEQVERHWRFDAESGQLVFDREAGLLAARLYYRRNENLTRAEELMRAVVHVTAPRDRWQFQILLAEIFVAAGNTEEAQQLAHEASHTIPESERIWRLRAADLANEDEVMEALLDALDDDERAIWEARQADRAGAGE